MGTERGWVQAHYHSVSLPAPPAGAGNREPSANMVAEAESGYVENKGTNFDNRNPPLDGKAMMSGKGQGWERSEGRHDPGLWDGDNCYGRR